MIEEKEKTAGITSVGADERQSTSKTSAIVTDSEPECNSKKKKLRELTRAMQTYNDPYYLPTVTMNDLFDTVYDGKPPVIENLLYPGLFVFAGAPKIGKSFLMLQIAYHVSTGLPLWEFPVTQSPVLYLALEDSYDRLQRRLYKMFGVEGTDDLYLSIASMQLGKGLDEQITWFLKKVPDTRLIIIDTLQKVREAGGDNFSYANDYEIISALKKIADASKICILVVHHTRKQQADDKFDMISGTNGILGAADGAFLLQKEKRTSNDAVLEISCRDLQDQKFYLKRNEENLQWYFERTETELWKDPPEPLLEKIKSFLSECGGIWSGTATELEEKLQTKLSPSALSMKLNVLASRMKNEYDIHYERLRNHDGRRIELSFFGTSA